VITGPSNIQIQALIQILDAADQSPIWRRISKELSASRRSLRPVNLEQININANDNDTVLIPSKVLGNGVLTKKINISALNFSEEARRKILDAGGTVLSIAELWEKNPSGSNIKILK